MVAPWMKTTAAGEKGGKKGLGSARQGGKERKRIFTT